MIKRCSELKVATHHEAAHVVAAWALDLPLQFMKVNDNGSGTTKLSYFYLWTAMFREVSRDSVRKSALFVLAGDCGEQLISFSLAQDEVTSDDYYAWFLARKFRLDLGILRNEAEQIIVRERDTVTEIAEELYIKRFLGPYDLAIRRMNWLARGSSTRSIVYQPA